MSGMKYSGLLKLTEECGELIQIAAKQIAYFGSENHPDGKGLLSERLSDEIADVLAAIAFVVEKLDFDDYQLRGRSRAKLERFKQWENEIPNQTPKEVAIENWQDPSKALPEISSNHSDTNESDMVLAWVVWPFTGEKYWTSTFYNHQTKSWVVESGTVVLAWANVITPKFNAQN